MSKYPVCPEYEILSEKDIVQRCQDGDLEAFNALISRYETRVLNMSLRYLRDYHRALDETQEIFLKVFSKINLFKGESAFATWLYRITANHCLNVIRERQSPVSGENRTLALDSPQQDVLREELREKNTLLPDEAYAREEMRRTIYGLLEKLPAAQRQAIILFHFEHLTYDEIAEIMKVPTTTVRACLYRARRRLQEMFLKGSKRP